MDPRASKAARALLQMTQGDVAAAVPGLSVIQLSHFESGARCLEEGALARLTAYYERKGVRVVKSRDRIGVWFKTC